MLDPMGDFVSMLLKWCSQSFLPTLLPYALEVPRIKYRLDTIPLDAFSAFEIMQKRDFWGHVRNGYTLVSGPYISNNAELSSLQVIDKVFFRHTRLYFE